MLKFGRLKLIIVLLLLTQSSMLFSQELYTESSAVSKLNEGSSLGTLGSPQFLSIETQDVKTGNYALMVNANGSGSSWIYGKHTMNVIVGETYTIKGDFKVNRIGTQWIAVEGLQSPNKINPTMASVYEAFSITAVATRDYIVIELGANYGVVAPTDYLLVDNLSIVKGDGTVLVDIQSPTTPTVLSSSVVTANSVVISWEASTDDIAVTDYEVFKNGISIGTTGGATNHSVLDLEAGTAYDFTVVAIDAASNVSNLSTVLSATTLNSGGSPTDGHWSKTGTTVSYKGGKVGIGTANPDYELTVKGKIHAEEVLIDLNTPAPDYVFKEEYELLSLKEVQAYIAKNGHLPNIPSAKVMETEGVELGAMEMKLLEKVEELTLYLLKQNKLIESLQEENVKVNKKLLLLEDKINK